MTWRLAPTLRILFNEINERWPHRDKTSDGTIGNASHAAGASDHNPDARGVVCAIDVDEDLRGPTDPAPSFHSGTPASGLVRELIVNAKAGLTPQLYYVIYERRIYSRTYGWVARAYTGDNAHDHHLHVSVYHDPKYADSTKTWGIAEDMPTSKEIATETLSIDGEIKNKDAEGYIFDAGAGDFISLKNAVYEIGKDLRAIKKKLV